MATKKQMGGNKLFITGGSPVEVRNSIILFLLYFTLMLVIGIGFDKIKKNETGVSRQVVTYALIGIIVPICIMIIALQFNNTLNILTEFNIKLLFLSIVILVFAGIVYFYKISSYIYISISILIIIIGLAIVAHKLYDTLERTIQQSSLKFFIQFLFFIPCIFNDILRWLLEQIHMTSYFTYIIIAIEISLILIYFYLPFILNTTIMGGDSIAKVLQREPFYINKGKPLAIATSATLKPPKTKNDILLATENTSKRDYAFSMWININAQNMSDNNEIVIFSYGYNDPNNNPHYKPRIVYKKSSDKNRPSVQNVYRVYFTEGNNNYYEVYAPNQRWNHFVINYIEGRMAELWINGTMERVIEFGKKENAVISVPNYDPTDLVTIGNTTASGTNGAICSVIYFYNSISSYKIVNLYNLGIDTKPYPGNY